MKTKVVVLIAIVCIVATTIGCIDEFKTEGTPIPTPIVIQTPVIPTPTTIVISTDISEEEFIDKYTKAEDIFKYDSYEHELKGNDSKNLADPYYYNNQFNEAREKYHEAAEFYSKAKEQNLEAKELFEEAYEIVPGEYYKELCELYISAAQSNAMSLEYLSSAMKYRGRACDYYEKEDYKAGDDNIEAANKEIIRCNIETEKRNAAVLKIDELGGW